MSYKKDIVIVGAGISGLSAAQLLQPHCNVVLLEKNRKPGGLIKCDIIDGNLFHLVGGHVFNSKNQQVHEWFWQFFDKEKEFRKAIRNAKIYIDGRYIGYPIENHLYQLADEHIIKSVLTDLLQLSKPGNSESLPENFESFLKEKFGDTLYDLYFGRYNKKIWNRDLSRIPLGWLDEKLPMPSIEQILFSNIRKQQEETMVHATFFYPAAGGSQFIIDRLSSGLDIRVDYEVKNVGFENKKIIINDGEYTADALIYSGDIRKMGNMIHQSADTELPQLLSGVADLPTNGTTNALCYTDDTDISWLYLPEEQYKAHRIIYTGNFSPNNNNGKTRKTCVVEFSGYHSKETVLKELPRLPGNLELIAQNFEPNSYIIHEMDTADKMRKVQEKLLLYNVHLLGRFAEWKYYNMDKCIESAIELTNKLLHEDIDPR